MYFFRPKKGYDPQPYSYFKRWLHNVVGCPIQSSEYKFIRNPEQSKKVYHFRLDQFCPCGKVHIVYLPYPRN